MDVFRERIWRRDGSGNATRPIGALRWVGVAAAFVNLGIHLAMAPDHIAEQPYIGVMFVIGSALLGMVMVGLSSDRDRLRTLGWTGGTVVCTAEFVLFVFSRTTGLPAGYHETWASGVEDFLGLASLFVEVVFVGCAAASLTRTSPRDESSGWLRWLPLHDRTAPLT